MNTRNLLPFVAAGAMLIGGCRQFFVADGSLDATDATETSITDGSDIVADTMDADASADADAGTTVPVRILFPTSGTTVGSSRFTMRIQIPADFDWSHVGAEFCTFPGGSTAWDQNCTRGHPPPDGGLNLRDVDAGASAGARVVDVDFQSPHGVAFLRFGELTGADTSGPSPRSDSAFARVSQFIEISAPRDTAAGNGMTGFETWGAFPDFDQDGLMDIASGGTGASDGGFNGAGEVYVYSGRSLVMGGNSAPAVHPESTTPSPGAEYGHVVASGGDINGDGYTDLLVGQPFGASAGTVFVYYGGPTFFTAHPMSQSITGASLGLSAVRFGSSVASIGDIDRDGYSDIIVGAPPRTDIPGGSGSGAYVLHGSASGLTTTGRLDFPFGSSGTSDGMVAGIGDIDRDGIPDFAMDTSTHMAGVDGTVVVYLHGDTTHPRTMTEASAGASYGSVIAPIGDVNRDGFADFAIGAPDGNHVYIYAGNTSGIPMLVAMLVPTASSTFRFGVKVNGGGDLNGDGYSDFGVDSEDGMATVFMGGPGFAFGTGDVLPFSDCAGNCLGGPVGISLDLDYDGDGFSDLVSGAANGVPGAISRFINVYRGGASLPTMPQFTLVGPSDVTYGQSITLAPRRRIDPLLGAALIAFDLR